MCSEAVSQAEIDALLQGSGPGPAWPRLELARLEQLLADFLGRGASVGPLLLGQALAIGPPSLQPVLRNELAGVLPARAVAVELSFVQGGQGSLYLLLPEALTFTVVGCLLGEPPAALDGSARGALAEVAGQLAGAGLGAVAEQTAGVPLAFDPPGVGEPGLLPPLPGELLLATFDLTLGDGPAAHCAVLLPGVTARSLLTLTQPPAPTRAAPAAGPAVAGRPAHATPAPAAAAVRTASLPELAPAMGHAAAGPRNIDLILDVTLQVTVELGRTKKQIREVLALGPGSLLELDKLAGEAVDVLVNGKLIARGEVVVIDENFGVRITDIVSPAERAATLR